MDSGSAVASTWPSIAMRLATPWCVAAAAIGFALHNGLQYGRSNHCQYLLHGLHAADPSYLQNDWFTTQTEPHHHAFNLLVEWLSKIAPLNVALGLLNAASAVAFVLALYYLAARFARRPLLPFAVALLLTACIGVNGPGHSNILLPYFVPSVFSGVAMLIAMTCLLYRRHLAAGIVAGLACAAHANYAAVVGPLWLLLLVLDRRGGGCRRAACLLVPWALGWLPHLPILMKIASQDAWAEQAHRIFWDIYAPLHYRPATWPWRPQVNYLLILGVGLLAARIVGRSFDRTTRMLLLALSSLVLVGALFTTVWSIDFVTAVYTWRLAPFLAVASFVAIGLCFDPGAPLPAARRVIVAVLALAFLWCTGTLSTSLALMMAVCTCLLAAVAGRASGRASRVPRLSDVVGLGLLLCLGFVLSRSGLWRKDMFGAPYKPPEQALYDWCRLNTDRDAVFIIPPKLTGFRLEARRAVVVDWKCLPILPRQMVEWHRRLADVCGTAFSSLPDAEQGYQTMDAARADKLRRVYNARFLIVDCQTHPGDLAGLRAVYANGRFVVYNLSPAADPDASGSVSEALAPLPVRQFRAYPSEPGRPRPGSAAHRETLRLETALASMEREPLPHGRGL